MAVDLPDLGEKVGPLPLWGWLGLGAGGVVLFVVLSNRAPAAAYGDPGPGVVPAPTSDQMTGNAINDLMNRLAQYQEAENASDQAHADTIAAMLADQADQAAAYRAQLAATNAAFFDQLLALMKSFQGNGTAPITTNPPPAASDPLAGAAQWLKDRLQSPYWQSRKYVLANDLNLGDQYKDAVNAFFRSDNPTGLNSAGQPSAAAQSQLDALIASGRAALNPLYHG